MLDIQLSYSKVIISCHMLMQRVRTVPLSSLPLQLLELLQLPGSMLWMLGNTQDKTIQEPEGRKKGEPYFCTG